jgi:hypothetical protein
MIEPEKPQNQTRSLGTLRSGKRIFTEHSEKYWLIKGKRKASVETPA